MTIAIIRKLNEAGIRVTTLTKGVYPDEFITLAPSLLKDNQYGISIVSLSETFRKDWEPGSARVDSRLKALRRLHDKGALTWASVEPYPTPNVDPTSANPAELLASIAFVDKAVFGRWNYNKLVNSYDGAEAHYLSISSAFADWAMDNDKVLHIKKGTPLHEDHSVDVLSLRQRGDK